MFSDSQVLNFYVSGHSYKMLMISFKQSVKLKSHTIYIIYPSCPTIYQYFIWLLILSDS